MHHACMRSISMRALVCNSGTTHQRTGRRLDKPCEDLVSLPVAYNPGHGAPRRPVSALPTLQSLARASAYTRARGRELTSRPTQLCGAEHAHDGRVAPTSAVASVGVSVSWVYPAWQGATLQGAAVSTRIVCAQARRVRTVPRGGGRPSWTKVDSRMGPAGSLNKGRHQLSASTETAHGSARRSLVGQDIELPKLVRAHARARAGVNSCPDPPNFVVLHTLMVAELLRPPAVAPGGVPRGWVQPAWEGATLKGAAVGSHLVTVSSPERARPSELHRLGGHNGARGGH